MNEKSLLKDKKQLKILGVSGGPDSMYLLNWARLKFGNDKIVVAHVNYNYRNDSIIDQNLVEHYCEKHNIKLEIETVAKEMYQDLAQNFESFAREIRYNFFAKVAKKYHSEVVFIAHNKNDLVETYLLQKKRQNLVKYYGLATLSELKDIWIYRPLLHLSKSEILAADDQQQIPYHIDKTNFDQKYERNKIRSTLKESELDHFVKEIEQANKTLLDETKKSEAYVKNGIIDEKILKLNSTFFKFETSVKKRILILFFQAIGKENLLLNRKKNTLQELVKLVDNELKPVLQLPIQDEIIVKDFDELYVVKNDFFSTYTLFLTNFKDLEIIKNVRLRKEVKKLISQDDERWPYKLTNDYENYKKDSFVKKEKTNRYFIKKKVKYKVRMQVPALVNNDNQVINIKSFFKLWDN